MSDIDMNDSSEERGLCRLVFVEWEDSAQPIPSWVYLREFDCGSAITCATVGWLVHDGDAVKAVAQNMGKMREADSMQVSGIIRIPTRCIRQLVELDEPTLTS